MNFTTEGAERHNSDTEADAALTALGTTQLKYPSFGALDGDE
jgi:hypothetical protein